MRRQQSPQRRDRSPVVTAVVTSRRAARRQGLERGARQPPARTRQHGRHPLRLRRPRRKRTRRARRKLCGNGGHQPNRDLRPQAEKEGAPCGAPSLVLLIVQFGCVGSVTNADEVDRVGDVRSDDEFASAGVRHLYSLAVIGRIGNRAGVTPCTGKHR